MFLFQRNFPINECLSKIYNNEIVKTQIKLEKKIRVQFQVQKLQLLPNTLICTSKTCSRDIILIIKSNGFQIFILTGGHRASIIYHNAMT